MKPTLKNLLLCDYGIHEATTGKVSCCGIFSELNAPSFPLQHLFYIYAHLTDGKGNIHFCIRIENIVTGEILSNVVAGADFKHPGRGLDILLRLSIVIKEPGAYNVVFLSGGEILGTTRLTLLQKEEKNGKIP